MIKIIFFSLCISTAMADYSKEAKDYCQGQPEPKCSVCTDGWFEEKYFEAKSKLFAFRRYARCTPCENKFQLLIGSELKDKSCLDFFEAIHKKQKTCKDCLTIEKRMGG